MCILLYFLQKHYPNVNSISGRHIHFNAYSSDVFEELCLPLVVETVITALVSLNTAGVCLSDSKSIYGHLIKIVSLSKQNTLINKHLIMVNDDLTTNIWIPETSSHIYRNKYYRTQM